MGIYGSKTKKELKTRIGETPNFIETSVFGNEYKGDGTYCVVGPSPDVRKWFAEITIKNGKISRVT